MLNIGLPVIALLLALAASANADWVDPGAAYLCDKASRVFVVKAVMLTSDPDEGTVIKPQGYSTFRSEKNFKCIIGKTTIDADIKVLEPHPGGNCAAYTYTYINSLRVNGKKVFPEWRIFNSPCSEDPVLYEIQVKQVGTKVHFEACYATWKWGVGFTKTSCDVQDF
jgi:hypothetical protein